MAKGAKKGEVRNPNGRGNSPNKTTTLAREAIARFIDGNADRLNAWLDEIASESPKDAFGAFASLLEYHVPKLARTELVGDKDQPVNHVVRWEE